MSEWKSETARYRHLTTKYCSGCGLDIGSQGDPVVPWAWQLELPKDKYAWYNSNHEPVGPVQLRGDAASLPVDDGSLDFVYCSYVLEYFPQIKWPDIFAEWKRVVKPGGYIVVLVPEVTRWKYAIEVLGQCPNCSHSAPEPSVGDLSKAAESIGLLMIEERLTDCFEHDYSIIGAFRKL